MIQPSFPSLMPETAWRAPDSFPDLSKERWLSIDCETCDPHLQEHGPGFVRNDAFVAGVAVHADQFSGYFPVRHGQGNNLAPNVLFEWLSDTSKHFQGELYGANLLYDLEALHFEGVDFRDDVRYCDVQTAEPLIDEETAVGYSLKVLANKYIGHGKVEAVLADAASKYTKGWKDKRAKRPIPFDEKSDLWKMPAEYVGEYAEGDVLLPRIIFRDHQSKILDKDELWDVFNLESSLIPILLKMRIHGTRVDLEKAYLLAKRLTAEIDKHSMDIKRLVGFDPNVDSGKEMLKAYETLNLRLPDLGVLQNIRYHKTGNPSFVAEWYAAQPDPLSRMVLKKKKLMTLRDDFVIGDIVKESYRGRIHCQFHPLRQDTRGTRSGRFSSTQPNLQQIPARHDDALWGEDSPIWSLLVRELFIPDENKKWLKADISQQEPRLTVHYAAKLGLPGADLAVQAFRNNPKTDYHTLTTEIVNSKTGKNYKRKQIKGINLGLVYGMGLAKLCRQLGVSEPEGREILTAYNFALPFVKAISNKAMEVAENRGQIRTILKRLRRFNLFIPIPENKFEREFQPQGLPRERAEQVWLGRRLQRAGVHKALNALIQGSAADQVKESMRVLYYEYGLLAQIQVHDELDGSVNDYREAQTFKHVVETAVTLEIPVVCEAELGDSWGTAHEEVLQLAA